VHISSINISATDQGCAQLDLYDKDDLSDTIGAIASTAKCRFDAATFKVLQPPRETQLSSSCGRHLCFATTRRRIPQFLPIAPYSWVLCSSAPCLSAGYCCERESRHRHRRKDHPHPTTRGAQKGVLFKLGTLQRANSARRSRSSASLRISSPPSRPRPG